MLIQQSGQILHRCGNKNHNLAVHAVRAQRVASNQVHLCCDTLHRTRITLRYANPLFFLRIFLSLPQASLSSFIAIFLILHVSQREQAGSKANRKKSSKQKSCIIFSRIFGPLRTQAKSGVTSRKEFSHTHKIRVLSLLYLIFAEHAKVTQKKRKLKRSK